MATGIQLALKFMVMMDTSGIIIQTEIHMCIFGISKRECKMKLVLEFDCDADIIEVPQNVIDNRDLLKKRFLKWLYSKQVKHKYWITMQDSNGKAFKGVKYRSDAFVEWLNKKVLAEESEKASIVEEYALEYDANLPKLQF